MTAAYPLAWPSHRPRTPWAHRKPWQFRAGDKPISRARAMQRLQDEVARLGGANILVSSDLELRRDGQPHLGKSEPADPGVCLYFSMKGQPYAMACDTYDSLAQNVAAIANHIEATRRIERYGVASASESLKVFVALPAPPKAHELLGISANADEATIRTAWRGLIATNHPDQGGSEARAAELNAARDDMLRRLA